MGLSRKKWLIALANRTPSCVLAYIVELDTLSEHLEKNKGLTACAYQSRSCVPYVEELDTPSEQL